MARAYTVGYESTDVDRFIATLKAVKVDILVDIRALALSRKKGFSKTALREHLRVAGIEYLHLSALGDPKPGRDAARAGKYEQFKKIYRTHLNTIIAKEAIVELSNLAHSRSCTHKMTPNFLKV